MMMHSGRVTIDFFLSEPPVCCLCKSCWAGKYNLYHILYLPKLFIPFLEVSVSLNTVPKPCGWKGIIFSHTGMAWWAAGQEMPMQNLLPTHGICLIFSCPCINLSSPVFHLDCKISHISCTLGLKPFTLMREIDVPGDAPMCWGHPECHGLTLWH